jgi:hypothetical protein
MKSFATILLLLASAPLLYAQTGTEPPPRATLAPEKPGAVNLNDSESARKARALLEQTIQALGGQAYLKAETRAQEGRAYALHHGESHELGMPYRQFERFPDRDRVEIIGRGQVLLPIPDVGIIVVGHEVKHKNEIVIIHNGDKGYETTYKGTAWQDREELEAYLRRRRHSVDWVLRKWINDPGVEYFYDGLAIVDGKPAERVGLLNNQNDSVTLFLDQSTHLPLKSSYSWRDPKDKQKNTEEEIYDNYKPEQGIMTPHAITRYFNGESSHQTYIYTAKYNLNMPDSLFEASTTYDPFQPIKRH